MLDRITSPDVLAVGDDFAGSGLGRELEARGVVRPPAVEADLPTGCVLILGECTAAERGANARLDPGDVPSALEAGAVLVSGYVPNQAICVPLRQRVARERRAAGDDESWPDTRVL